MNIAILDASEIAYTVSTYRQEKLNIGQLSLCHISEALAEHGYNIFLFNSISQPRVDPKVVCLPLQVASPEFLSSMDCVIIFNAVEKGIEIAKDVPLSTRLILLINSDREVFDREVEFNPTRLESFDRILFGSEWQIQNSVDNHDYFVNTWLQILNNPVDSERFSQKGYRFLLQEKYDYAIEIYEQAIFSRPQVFKYYWYYGLCLLLQNRESEAQAAWLSPFLELEPSETASYTGELVAILHQEAKRQEFCEKEDIAWAIRQHIREIEPTYLENLISLIYISVRLGLLAEYKFLLTDFAEILQQQNLESLDFDNIVSLLFDILTEYPKDEIEEEIIDSVLASYKAIGDRSQDFLKVLLPKKANFINQNEIPAFAIMKVASLCLQFEPTNFALWIKLSGACYTEKKYDLGIYAAEKMLQNSADLTHKIIAYFQMMQGLLSSGIYHERAQNVHKQHLQLLEELIQSRNPQEVFNPEDIFGSFQMITATCYFPYLGDTPKEMHWWRGQVGSFWQKQWQVYLENSKDRNVRDKHLDRKTNKTNKHDRLRVGYISSSLRRHSVGHLSGWLFQEYDRDNFDFYIYSLQHPQQDTMALFFERNSYFRDFTNEEKLLNIFHSIQEDEIDILVDLDGFTSQKVSRIMLMKPAPIQATWLGFDASGIPAIDYFIADSYVLPEIAQQYYNETIWRLPQTYIGVAGFEVGVPSIHRENLDIPDDAVIYFSSQTGQKRNPKNIRLQMQILWEVPNSYFVTKTVGADQDSIQRLFKEIATEEGIDSDRLRFLSRAPSETVHRANIGIADVVLDTYPYNGATTTMETLWMEVPMVTRVGEQFAARNSYAMMVNAGIEEGIAWTDEEYVEWGIRLGTEPQLRKEVSWKLKQSKKSAPLWNAKQFTRDMEAAYQQMWQKYIEESSE